MLYTVYFLGAIKINYQSAISSGVYWLATFLSTKSRLPIMMHLPYWNHPEYPPGGNTPVDTAEGGGYLCRRGPVGCGTRIRPVHECFSHDELWAYCDDTKSAHCDILE